MTPAQFSLRRPLTVVVLVLAVTILAGLGWRRMTRDVFPSLGVPTIYVAQPYGGMDPGQMEGFLTYYYEYHFLYLTGIEHVESKSIQGASIMKLQFHPGTDMSQAMAETIAYVNRARAFMPPGTVPPFVTRFDAGSVPVGYLVFSTANPNRSVAQMQDAALNLVRPLFATLPGVSAPPPFGGSARTIVVNVRPDDLRAYQLSPQEVVAALARSNVISPSGNVNLGDKYAIVQANAVARNIQDLAGVPLRTTARGAVFLRDIATVEDASDLVTSYALVNGRRTVYLPVTKRADASTVAVVGLVKQNLAKFQEVLPDDIRISYEFDQSPVVLRAIGDLVREGWIGAILAGLMVLLFLRDWRSALVVVLNIPLALLAAVAALWGSGQNINLMTLGGLALAVGILVDESTVGIENIHAHLARGRTLASATYEGIQETAVPRLLAMLCVLAVFVPAFFMAGAAKALFVPLALAVGFSMIASYLLSSTLLPILSVWVLRGRTAGTRDGRMFAGLQRRYTTLLERLDAVRWLIFAAYLAGAAGIVWVVGGHLGTEIFPRADAGQIAFRLHAPTGTRLEATEALALRALQLVQREAGSGQVQLTLGLVGVHAPNYPINLIYLWNGGPDEAYLQVQLRPGGTGRTEQLTERLRSAFRRELPEANITFEPSDIVSRVMSFGASAPIEISVGGPSLDVSRAYAEKALARLARLSFLRDVHFTQALDYPSVEVAVDREKAGLTGVDMIDVTNSLLPATTSSRFTVPNYWADPVTGVAYNLQVQIPQERTTSLENLRNIPVTSHSGKPVLLRAIAQITPGIAVGQYERYNMVRQISIDANLSDIDLGTALSRTRAALADLGPLPPKTAVALRGEAVPLEELMSGLRQGLLAAVGIVFLLLAANFQSIRLSLVAVSALPGVIAGVVLALWSTQTTLNVQSFTGAIMAVGVAMANAILLVTFAERARQAGATALAAGRAGARDRLRPILMTSCAMVAGMMPMALGLGASGAQSAPLGRAVIGGLAAGTLSTLFVLPSVFALLLGRRPFRSASLDPRDPVSPHYQPASPTP